MSDYSSLVLDGSDRIVRIAGKAEPPSPQQRWRRTDESRLENLGSRRMVLDVEGDPRKGAYLIMSEPSSTPTPRQQWTLANGYLECHANRDLVVGVKDGLMIPGTPVQLWTPNRPSVINQIWVLDDGGCIASPAKDAGSMTFVNAGMYVARFTITTTASRSGQTRTDHFTLPVGRKDVKFEMGSTQIRVIAEANTGLAWAPWKTIFDHTVSAPADRLYTLVGTTWSPAYKQSTKPGDEVWPWLRQYFFG